MGRDPDYFSDACYQALAYWIMSAMTNDPFTLARYAGLYKALQSAGAAGSYGMDAVATPFLNEHLASWLMMLASLLFAGVVVHTVKETNYADAQVVYVDDVQKARAEEGHAPGSEGEGEKASMEKEPEVA